MDKLKPYLLPLIIGVLSFLSLIDNLDFSNIPKLIVSVVGVVSIVLFFMKNEKSPLLIKAWIIAQIPYIVYEGSELMENGVTLVQTVNYWNTSQVLNLGFGLTLDSLELKINFVPFLFLGFYRLLKANNMIGKEVDIISGLKRDNKLGKVFPLSGVFTDTIKFEDKSIWMVTKLNKSFSFNNTEYETILLHPKADDVFKINKRQFAFLRLVSPKHDIENLPKEKQKYQFIDYAAAKII